LGRCKTPVILFRVVWGRLEVTANFLVNKWFKSVDLPTLGLPTILA